MPPPSGRHLNVYVLDDHDIVRQGLRDLLATARDIYVVGDSGSARTAAASILRLETQVMVLDLQLQDGNGIQVCRQVRAVDPSVKGLLLTSADDDDALAAAVLAGAAGSMVKLTRSSHILQAVRALGAGRTLIDQDLHDRASSHLRTRARAMTPPLTTEEAELLDHVLAGHTDQQIAEKRGVDLGPTQDAVAALTERIMITSPGSPSAPETRTGGKHRRTS
jgi:two-component system response regulator DevR